MYNVNGPRRRRVAPIVQVQSTRRHRTENHGNLIYLIIYTCTAVYTIYEYMYNICIHQVCTVVGRTGIASSRALVVVGDPNSNGTGEKKKKLKIQRGRKTEDEKSLFFARLLAGPDSHGLLTYNSYYYTTCLCKILALSVCAYTYSVLYNIHVYWRCIDQNKCIQRSCETSKIS